MLHFQIASFNDLREIFLPEVKFEHLSSAYQRVEDIDLLVGVLAEKPLKGSLVGPTMACIIGKQMQRVSILHSIIGYKRSDFRQEELIVSGTKTISLNLDSVRVNFLR